jgi:DNA-binding response OmpR family regulator
MYCNSQTLQIKSSKTVIIVDKIPTVLIVDDDQAICNFIGEVLAEDGYTCEVALNAHDAFAKIQNHHFDVALLDIRLPDKSGIDLLEASQSFFQTTSTIMITAVKDLNTAIQAMKIGATDYVVKPFTIDHLTASIAEALKNRKRHNSVSTQTERMKDTDKGKNAVNQSIKTINAIAMGVDAQVDYFDFHSKIVTEKTVKLGRRLGLPAKEIEKWEIIRNGLYSERRRYISTLMGKLERNPLAQVMLGLTNSVNKFPQAGGEQN